MADLLCFHLRTQCGWSCLPLAVSVAAFQVTVPDAECKVVGMKFTEIKQLVERQPFRAFGVRLSNGAQYSFNNPREFGAPRDYHIIFFFGESEAVRIDTENIVEIFEK